MKAFVTTRDRKANQCRIGNGIVGCAPAERQFLESKGRPSVVVGAQGLFHTFSVLNHHALCAPHYAVLFIAASKCHTSACKLDCWGSKQSVRHLDALKRAFALSSQIPECEWPLPSISCMTKGDSLTLSQPWFRPW